MSRMGDVKYLVNLGDKMSVSNRSSYFNIAFNVLFLTISTVAIVIAAVALTNSEMHDKGQENIVNQLKTELKAMNMTLAMNLSGTRTLHDTSEWHGNNKSLGIPSRRFQQLNKTIQMLQKTLQQATEKLSLVENSVNSPNYLVTICSAGLKSGKVPNGDISASSIYDYNHKASNGRLDYDGSSIHQVSSWCAKINVVGQWIQVDLGKPTSVTGVVTQGRGGVTYAQWITSYKVSYGSSLAGMETIKSSNGIDQIFPGNSDRNSYVINRFPNPITARYFRIIAQTWHRWIAIRFDLITC